MRVLQFLYYLILLVHVEKYDIICIDNLNLTIRVVISRFNCGGLLRIF